MGWRAVIRSMAAAQRAAEREAVRRHRQHLRLVKEAAKLESHRQAAFEVERYENWIDRITSIHRDASAPWDWGRIVKAAPPAAPKPTNERERRAVEALEQYRPTLLDRVLRRGESRRATLSAAVRAAWRADADDNALAQRMFASQLQDWTEMRDLASRILAMDVEAWRDATNELSPFAELSDLGSRIEFTFRSDGVATATLHVNEESVVPNEVKSLLQSGKLSTKRMPQGRFYELYQDYVAGATLRIARELFALLPLNTVYATSVGRLLDSSSGYVADTPILSAMIPRETLDTLRFETLDPSDALRNFKHRMDFKKTKGFGPVEPLVPEPLRQSDAMPRRLTSR